MTRTLRLTLVTVVAVAAIAAATVSSTSALANRVPGVSVPPARVMVGETIEVRAIGFDLDFDQLEMSTGPLPAGVRLVASSRNALWFAIDGEEAGRLTWDVTATDEAGASRTRTAVVDVRYPHDPDRLLGLGDSVASGFGLQRTDYLNRDPCWRDEGDAYPRQVFDALVAAGELTDEATFGLLACQGFRAADLLDRELDGTTQVERAVAENPGVLTLTVGANDVQFSAPDTFVVAGRLDRERLDARLDDFADALDEVLATLVDSTDSRIIVTNYYDPSAGTPEGVDGCRGACFSDLLDDAVEALNTTIADVVGRHPAHRVVLVDLVEPFRGHGAPNGLGPDGIRSGGWGILGRVLGRYTAGVHAFCSQDYTRHDTYVSAVDCVHPDADGARVIAETIVAALDR